MNRRMPSFVNLLKSALRLAVLAACGAVFAGSSAAENAAAVPVFTVKSVRIEGNTLLPEADLHRLLDRLVGDNRTLAELRQGAAAVQAAYRDAGYGGVLAYVPQQAPAAGEVIIRILEGKLAAVRIKGEPRFFRGDNVRASLPNLREGQTPLVRAIDRDIQLSNENPAKELRVTLLAGSKPGDIDGEIEVVEENPLRWLASLENTGDLQTGSNRLGIGVQHANLFGADHVGTAQFQTSVENPGQVQLYSLGYRLPLYGMAAALDAFYAYSSVDSGTTATPAGPMSFAGRGTVFGLRANRYLERIGEYDHRVVLGVDWREYDNDCRLGSLGAAACGPASADIRIVPLSLAYVGQAQSEHSFWGFSAALHHNLGGSSRAEFDSARRGAERAYHIARFSVFGEFALTQDFGLNARLTAQYSPHALVPGEQLGLGGATSVRGYRERELAGDSGYFASLEAVGPDVAPLFGSADSVRLRPLLFVDHGRVRNHQDKPCSEGGERTCSLSSVGAGLRLDVGKNATLRFDLGRALVDGAVRHAGSYRGHFAIRIAF